MKVGELAKRTGISVRALHHYDEVGLLSPSEHSESGHRIYNESDIARLQQIVSLKALGLSLTEIADFLQSRDVSPVSIIEMHLAQLKKELDESQKLAARLEKVGNALKSKQQPTVDELLNLIEAINMFEKHYSQDDLAKLADRAQTIGEDQIRQYEREWSELIAQVKTEMEKGTAPGSEKIQQHARQWQKLLGAFTGGDPSITQSLGRMYKEEGAAKASQGVIDDAVFRYMGEAIKHLNSSSKAT